MNSSSRHRPLRVLHVIESLGTGGMENGVVNLVNGHNPSIVSADVLCTRGLGEFSQRIPEDKVHFDDSVGASISKAARFVRRISKSQHFDIVHSHSWSTLIPGYFGVLASRTPKFVHGEHGSLFLDSFKRRAVQRFILNRADRCLAVSNSLMAEITETLNISKQHFSVIINGVDTAKFRPGEIERNNLLEQIRCDKDTVIIGSVGRMVAVKDYPTLVLAFAKLCAATPSQCRLVFVGDGQERHRLEELVRNSNVAEKVHFLGESDAVEQLLPAFDIFVLPSVHEGMSNTLLESAACGVVAVASDIAPNREVVVESTTGTFFEVGNPDSLCKKLDELVRNGDERKRFSKTSRQYAVDYLSIEKMIQSYESFYSSMVGRKAA